MTLDLRLYDSDSEDDGEQGDITLGFADGPVPSTSAVTLDATTSKIGGLPVFWPCHCCVPPLVTCGMCASPLPLVCQLYVPQEGEEADERHRALFVFSCLRKACHKETGCVRAFSASRWDASLARKAAQARHQERLKTVQQSANPFSANPFSSALPQAGNPFSSNLVEEEAKVEELSVLDEQGGRLTVEDVRPLESWPDNHPALPAYYIATLYENTETSSTPQIPSLSSKATDNSEAGWNNEAYEATAKDERIFLAFQERIARDGGQGQVVRVGSTPLPFSAAPVEPPVARCSSCGRTRLFEAQIMPHTVDLLEKSLDADGGQELGWSTILIWTCPSVACADASQTGSSWIEEGVRLQFE